MHLAQLLHPVSPASFFREYWEREALHVARSCPSYFESLSNGLSLEQVVWQTCKSWGEVSLARAKTDYALNDYSRHAASLATVRAAFADDYTVVVNDLQLRHLPVARLCRALERDLLFDCNANLYVTKAGTQGLDYHYDDQDVFVLQLMGSKRWKVYERRKELPLDDGRYEHIDCSGSPATEYLLAQGDLLYLPRGFIHEAQATSETSVHLTVSVAVVRWVTLLHGLIDEAARDHVELRRGADPRLLRSGGTAPAAVLDVATSALQSSDYLLAAVARLQHALLERKQRLPNGAALPGATGELGLTTRVGVATDQVPILLVRGGVPVLNAIGTRVELSPDLEAPLRFMCECETFTAADVPGLEPDEALALVGRLLECQFLEARS